MCQDVHSFSRPTEAVVRHLDLDLRVDFEARTLSGKASLRFENRTRTDTLFLDTRDLTITGVTVGEDEAPADYRLGPPQPFRGQALAVPIAPETRQVHVYYSTRPEAAALQWLTPEQTAGGHHPFLFTQSQAILARTWVPCQDSPGVRFTYTATIRTDPDLLAVMSAQNPTRKAPDGLYRFNMPQPIPSYLLALAVGDLAFQPMSDRTGVYAEPALVAKAAWEFAETEQMMAAAEKLYGPYRWQRYDIIVLPPSFPFGGMENPRLTFATPTVLAGDRSLVALVAHELAHSWSGNLVTNATWNDFWLNEGFTTYLEHRIMEELHGRDYAEMLASLSFQDLQREMQTLPPADTHLHLDLHGRDPDEGMTAVPYDKGHFFLRTLEHIFEREKWDGFLRAYFNRFAFGTMTSARFLDYLRQQLVRGDRSLEEWLQLEAWVYEPGIPDNVYQPASRAFAQVDKALQAWQQGTPARTLNTTDWTTHHWLHFLRNLPEALSGDQMAELDAAFGFSETGNAEILHAWLLRAIANRYRPAYRALERFLTSQGRRKFLRPLYQKLAETPEGLALAKRIYRKARPTYHPISVRTVDEILQWAAPRP